MTTMAIIIVAVFALAAVAAFLLLRQSGSVQIDDLRTKRELSEESTSLSQPTAPPRGTKNADLRSRPQGDKPPEPAGKHIKIDGPLPFDGPPPPEWADQPFDGEFAHPEGGRVRMVNRDGATGEPDFPGEFPSDGPMWARPLEPPKGANGEPEDSGPLYHAIWDADNPDAAAPDAPAGERGGPANAAPGGAPGAKDIRAQGKNPDPKAQQKPKPGSKSDPTK